MSDYAGDVVKKILEEYGVEPIDQEVKRLRAENTALREIVEAVADGLGWYFDGQSQACAFCDREAGHPAVIQHRPDCLVLKARALLRQSAQEVE